MPKVGAPSRHPAQHRPVPNRGRGAFWPPPGDFTGKPRPPLPIIGSTCCDVGLGHTTGHLSTLANTLPGYPPPHFHGTTHTTPPIMGLDGGVSRSQTTSHTCCAPRYRLTLHTALSHGTTPTEIVIWADLNSPHGYCTFPCSPSILSRLSKPENDATSLL